MTALILTLLTISASATTLEDALRAALQKNESVGQADEKVVQAKERLSQAWSAPQPTLLFQANHLMQEAPKTPLYRQFSPPDQSTANLNLTQPLFSGFREFAGLRQTKDYLRSEKAKRMGALADLYEQVAGSYLDILSLEQDLRNLEDQRQIYAARVKSLSARSKRGEAARYEPLTAQSTEAVTEAEIQLARMRLRTARENFNYLTGLPEDSELKDPTASIDKMPTIKDLGYYLDRVEARPDITSARELLKASEEGVSMAKGTHWPTLDVVGNYYFLRPEGFLDEIDWDVTFRFTFPIYEGGLRTAQTREAVSKKRESDLELNRLRRQASAEIRALHKNLALKEQHLDALRRATELSRRNSEMVERDFKRGLAKNIDVQAAVAEYGIARRSFDQARFAARLDLIRLERATYMLPPVIDEYARKEEL